MASTVGWAAKGRPERGAGARMRGIPFPKAVPVSILAYGHPPELEALHDAVVLEIVEDDGIRRLHDVLPILCILEDGAVPLLERGGILDLGDEGVVDIDVFREPLLHGAAGDFLDAHALGPHIPAILR